MEGTLEHWADFVVIVLYFMFVLAIGMWSLCRPNRAGVKGYFLAGRDMLWWPVGASLFASNIGSEHFVGLAGTGAASGIAVIFYEWSSMPLVLLLGWVFLPVYLSAGVYTLPEYLSKRFGGTRLRIYISCLALILYIVTKIAVSIYAGALFIQLSLGWNLYLSIVILLSVTCIYTVLGGLAAVIYTDTAQTVIMTVGAIILAIISLNKVGGYESLQHEYFMSSKTGGFNSSSMPSSINSTLWTPATNDVTNSSCGAPPSDAFHIFRNALTSDSPWLGLLLQSTLGCLWYWCADQVIVQRTLAARNLTHAKGGAILAGYLKILPLFLMIFPGMISRALYPDEVGCTDPIQCEKVCGNPVGCTNIAYPKLVMTLLPVGLRGLLLAAMMSAIMSSLTSIFNSASTLFTMDLWRRARPRATQRELLIVGRLCILVLCVVSVLWVPLLQTSAGGQLFVYIQAVQGYLGTPIGALFLLAIFWTRMNEQGAFWGILVGHACGMTRLILDMTYPAPACGMPDNRPGVISKLHYSYFGQINLLLTTAVCVIVSLLTAPLPKERIEGVTWWTRLRGEKTPDEERQEEKEREMVNVDKENNEAEELVNDNNKNDDHDPKSKMAVVEVKTKQQTLMRRWVKFLCGIPEAQVGVMDSVATRQRLLYEQPKWRTFVNMNACLGLIVIAFLLGYYH